MPVYMNSLSNAVFAYKPPLLNRFFTGIEEVKSLPERIIFNCLGFGSKKVFNDNHMIPIRGQLLIVPQAHQENYILHHKFEEGRKTFVLFPRPSQKQCIIGLTYEIGVDDPRTDKVLCDELFNNAQQFFQGNLR